VIDHYNVIPGDNTNLDPRLRRPGGQVQNLNLTQQEKNELIAFLGTLTGSAVYTDKKWSDPFNAAGELSLIILPADAVAIQNHGNGTATVSCHAAPGLQYQLWSAPDLASWTPIATVTPDAAGFCQALVPVSGTAFYRYTYTVPAP
jgi:cytochrome c peroxidase